MALESWNLGWERAFDPIPIPSRMIRDDPGMLRFFLGRSRGSREQPQLPREFQPGNSFPKSRLIPALSQLLRHSRSSSRRGWDISRGSRIFPGPVFPGKCSGRDQLHVEASIPVTGAGWEGKAGNAMGSRG